MDTAQSSHEKRSIKVRDFLEDFRSGITDADLMEKYNLSVTGLEKFYTMLLDRNIIDLADFQGRPDSEEGLSDFEDSREVAGPDDFGHPSVDRALEPFDNGVEKAEAIERHQAETDRQAEAAPVKTEEKQEATGTVGAEKAKEIMGPLDEEWLRGMASLPATPDDTKFICPSCLYSQEAMFETCPDCGISIRDFLEPLEDVGDDHDTEKNHVEEHPAPELVFSAEPVQESESELAFPDEPALLTEEKPRGTQHKKLDLQPIEIPLSDRPSENPFIAAMRTKDEDEFVGAPEFHQIHAGFSDMEEVVPGVPLDYVDRPRISGEARCGRCDETLEPEVRRFFDRRGGLTALAVSVVFLLLGCMGAGVLAVFDKYSIIRLVLIYSTGLSMLLGSTLLAMSLVMLVFAKERIFRCYRCHRVYPRV